MSDTLPLPTVWHCAACGYTCAPVETPDPEQWEAVAWHEAGHAVMRWLRGSPLGSVCIHLDGTGLCDTSAPGLSIRREDALLIMLAGPVAETEMLFDIDFDASQSHNLDEAREALTPNYLRTWFFPPLGQEEALRHCWNHACDLLCLVFPLVAAVTETLQEASFLSAEALQAMCTR